MITIEYIRTSGWEAAIRGMRNPMNSWEKSDSGFRMCESDDVTWMDIQGTPLDDVPLHSFTDLTCMDEGVSIGPGDLDLMERLAGNGPVHGKFLRMITVTMDITAPLYWWKEFDTYKVGTVANSCSTMHKIHAKKFTVEDFSADYLISCHDADRNCDISIGKEDGSDPHVYPKELMVLIVRSLNAEREKFLETGDKQC